MSLVTTCELGNLSVDQIFRLVSGIDVDGDVFVRLFDDGTDPDTLSDLADCGDGVRMLDILRGALVTNDDGEFALNVVSL